MKFSYQQIKLKPNKCHAPYKLVAEVAVDQLEPLTNRTPNNYSSLSKIHENLEYRNQLGCAVG